MARFDNRRHAMAQDARSVGQDNSQDDGTFALAGAASVLGAGTDIPDTGQLAGGGAPAAPLRQIVFIEGDVPEAEALADGVAPGVRAVILNAGADGMQQIAAYLASHEISDLASISIVAHGSDGAVALGSGVLSAATIGQYMSELAVIGAAVRPGGDLQLFGCDVAADPAGVAFLDQVSAATGVANVAASSHLVGAAADGGSWTLNVDVGAPTVSQPFTAAAEAAYPDVLGTTTDRLYDVADTFLNTNEADTQILDLGVNGGAVSGSQGTVVNDTNGALGLANNQFYGLAIDTPNQKYYLTTYNGNSGGNNEIFAGSLAGGTPTAIFTQATDPSNINGGNDFFQIDGLALDQPNGELYFARLGDGFQRQRGADCRTKRHLQDQREWRVCHAGGDRGGFPRRLGAGYRPQRGVLHRFRGYHQQLAGCRESERRQGAGFEFGTAIGPERQPVWFQQHRLPVFIRRRGRYRDGNTVFYRV